MPVEEDFSQQLVMMAEIDALSYLYWILIFNVINFTLIAKLFDVIST